MPEDNKNELVWMSNVKTQSQEWIWKGVMPLGELCIIGGVQGIGKSLTTMDIAARVTTGRTWPDKSVCEEGSVLLMAAEDHISRTIRPRLMSAHADMSRVAMLRGVKDKKNPEILMQFDVYKDYRKLVEYLDWMKASHSVPPRAVIIDPITSFMGGTDSNRETKVREIMGSLKRLAEFYDVAVICIMHVKKGADDAPAMEKLMGSTGFTASARCVWVFCQCPDNDDIRYFLPVKNNLVKRSLTGWKIQLYSGINEQGAIKWIEKTTLIADDLLSDQGMAPEANRAKAKEIIVRMLKKGMQLASKVREAVASGDISEHTCNNAKKELGVRSAKSSDGHWYWWMEGLNKPPVKKKVKKTSEVDKLKSSIVKRVLSPKQESRRVQCVREYERGDFGENE